MSEEESEKEFVQLDSVNSSDEINSKPSGFEKSWKVTLSAEETIRIYKAERDSMQKLGLDALTDPFYENRWKLNPENEGVENNNRMGYMVPAYMIIDPEELYRASMTPKGAYITRVSIKFAFFQGWKFVKSKSEHEVIQEGLLKRLVTINKEWKMKNIVIQMCRTGAIFSRSLVFLQEKPPSYKGKTKLFLRVAPIFEQDIEYNNESGWVKMYHPMVQWGNGIKRLNILPEKAVLFIWDLDENGNLFQGIPALIPAYQTILRSEIVSEEFSTTIAERGLGYIDILVKRAKSLADLTQVRKAFRLGRDKIFVHGENYETKAMQGMSTAFNFDEAMGRYTKDTSSSTGYPGMAIEGVQVGAVTGSETDQDNRAQMYRIIQETAEPYILELYQLIDKSLAKEDFELEWDFEIKQDMGKKANILATFGGAINQIQDLITVDQALYRLQLPPRKNKKEGEMLLSAWIAENSPLIDTNMSDNPEKTNNGVKAKDYPKDEISEPETEEEKATLTKTEKDSVTTDTLKKEIAKRLLLKGDSYNAINTLLSLTFGSGLSNSTIQELKNAL